MDPRLAARALLAMEEERALELLADLGSQPAVAVLRMIDEPVRGRLIAGLPAAAAFTAKLLVQFVDDSAGSCVDPNAIALAATTTTREALERVRVSDAQVDTIFVVDDQRRLLGWARLDTLLRAHSESRLATLMLEPTSQISVHSPLSGALAHPGWETATTLPAVDRGGRFIGVLVRASLEGGLRRLSRSTRPAEAAESLSVMLLQGYWQSISGILEALTASLPAANARGSQLHER
jgi:Mg/Co/Ni transporter MgtE